MVSVNKVLALPFLLLLPATGQQQQDFVWKDSGSGGVQLLERGNPVLTYNDGQQLKAGASEDRRRCCYIFPLYTPAGVSVLDDFPQNHPHHRGLFWAWPVVETTGKTYDLWMNMTVKQQSGKKLLTQASAASTSLDTNSVWQVEGRDIVQQSLRLTVFPSANSAREFLVELTLEALGGPVTLRGSREEGKSYGGFSARFAPRTTTILRADGQTLTKDEDLTPRAWAELEGVYSGKRATLRITPDPGNPRAPYQWCLRGYGFVGASFPGRTDTQDGYTIEPGKPLTLKFRVRVSDQ